MKPKVTPHSLPLVAPRTVAALTEIVQVNTSVSSEAVKIEEHVFVVTTPAPLYQRRILLHRRMIPILAASTEIVQVDTSVSSEAVKHEEHVLDVMPLHHQMIPKLVVGITTVLTLTPSVAMMLGIV